MSSFLSHPIPAVVILLGLLVFFHEFGHFVVGRACGIAVETFSIGFGPRIFGFTHGGTDYRFSWIPLGGYVKFAGAHPSEDVPPGLKGQAFLKTSLPKRMLTVLAGPFFNFLLAVGVYMLLGATGMPHPPALIGDVVEGSPAAAAGIQYGDRIVAINGAPTKVWHDLEEAISGSPGKELTITIERDGSQLTLHLTPEAVKTTDLAGRPVSLGRAGIALGRAPAILSVVDAGGIGAQAGLHTGDQVQQVTVGGKTEAVEFLPDLVKRLERAAAAGEATAVLKVAQAPVPTERPENLAPAGSMPEAKIGVQEVTLPIAALKSLPATAPDREALLALGLRASEMTIAGATDTAKGVLQKGDILLAWDGRPLRDVFSLREELVANTAPEVKLTVLRAFVPTEVPLKLQGIEVQRPEGMVTMYTLPVVFWGQPLEPESVIEKYTNPLAALAFGVRQTADQTRELVINVASLVTGDIPLKALGGPMLIAKVAGDSARRGWQTFLGSMALISINLGLLNLFPIPVLDGGQLVLMAAEAVRRRPLREAAVENFQKVGFAMILALVVLATYNDLSRFWRSMLESVVGLFQ